MLAAKLSTSPEGSPTSEEAAQMSGLSTYKQHTVSFPSLAQWDRPSDPAVDPAYRPCRNLWDGLRIQRLLPAMLAIPLPLPGCLSSLSTEAVSFLPNTRWVS